MAVAVITNGDVRDSGVPASVLVSIAIHVLGMIMFIRMGKVGPVVDKVTINDVELMIEQEKENPAKPKPRVRRRKMTKNFLKLALPSIPKPRARMEVEAPKRERIVMQMPHQALKDRRMKVRPKMAALDLSKKRAGLAKIQAPLVERKSRNIQALPKLAEIGMKRAPKKLQQLDMLRERTSAPAARSLKGAMDIDLGAARRKFEASGLTEARPKASTRKKSLADMLTSERPAIDMGPRSVPVTRKKPIFEDIAKPLPKRRAAKTFQDAPVKKKAIEIEGEIENRRVVSSSIPRFPGWAVDQGLIEAEVRIKFFVGSSGAVLEDGMKVERSSGYGRLDRLAMGHLKKWRFESRPFGTKNEYGIITFRFLLE